MRSNLSKLTRILASTAIAATTLAAIPAMADSARLNIPFSFTVDGKLLPAGEYRVQSIEHGNLVNLRNADSTQYFTWIAGSSNEDGRNAVLRFTADGNVHALQSVRIGPLVTPNLIKKAHKTEDISAPNMSGR
jgi:hypothetical protein